ncbi:phosphatase PAP2 family protein [Janibacter anophelis]|uniref:phosphatase PAP2 family protein n=1 Tax=Janibacter anophelis TaxID=319054 RepID=UPI0013B04D6A|nr:phosphatase PAP2 family protein [Janibacter anophelis]
MAHGAGGAGQRAWRRVVLTAVAFLAVYVVAVLTEPGQRLDDEVFGLVQHLTPAALHEPLQVLARRVLPVGAAVAGSALWLAGLWHRRWLDVLRASVVVLVATLLSRGLRLVLPRPDHGYSYDVNTLPSTHATTVVAVGVAVWVLWPGRRPSWLPAGLAAVVVMACQGNVVGYAHRPSDVLASVLLVATVTGVVDLIAGRWPIARRAARASGYPDLAVDDRDRTEGG